MSNERANRHYDGARFVRTNFNHCHRWGQAGLAVGYHLSKRGLPFLILDAGARVGDAWRNRWDSHRLFTPARYTGFPGWRFPARGDAFPTKDQMADYLESCAKHFDLPVRTGMKMNYATQPASGYGMAFRASSWPRLLSAHRKFTRLHRHKEYPPRPNGREAQRRAGSALSW